LQRLVRQSVSAAQAALEAHAEDVAVALSELATTLVLVAVRDGTVCAAQVGDGAVVAETDDGLALVSGPNHGEYVNEVVPLTASAWLEELRISPCVRLVRAVAVFTDGCERAALRRDRGSPGDLVPHQGFFLPLFAFGRSVICETAREGELGELLASPKMAE